MRITWNEYYEDRLLKTAEEMALAARTAPKGRGRDQLHILILTGQEKDDLAEKMKEIGQREDIPFFLRDSENLLAAPVVLLIGTEVTPLEVPCCGYCGLSDCRENRDAGNIPCAFSSGDLGIALGSAVSLAARRHIDNRIMFSAGKAALQAGLFPPGVRIAHGIPLAATGKNPFFDRK